MNNKSALKALAGILFACLSLSTAFAQVHVSGTVYDNNGEALTGAGVVEKGTSNGVVTDLDGKYQLVVKEGATLVFSFIGFADQEIPARAGTLDVILQEDANILNDVVVIGYGSTTRKDITSSITTVKSDDLNVGVYTDPASLLQGKVAGLVVTQTGDPNGTPSITLRGASTLRTGAAMQPYYVVDGVPGVDLSLVAADDIESIDVLRDASATAIYGSKAANGVIIVTTKKGKEGRVNVGYNGYVAFDKISKNLEMMSADDLRAYARANNFTLTNDQGASTDWTSEVQRTAVSHNHNVSISGANQKSRYSASINYIDRQGVIVGSDMKRLNARSFVQATVLKDRLTLSLSANAAVGSHRGVWANKDGASVYDAMYYYAPTAPVKNADGSWFQYGISQNYNPVSLINEDTSETVFKRIQMIGKAALTICDGLVWNTNASIMNHQRVYSDYHGINSFVYTADHGHAHRNTYFGDSKSVETYVNYDKTFSNDHKVGLMGGYSWEESNENDGFGVTVYDFYDDTLKWNQLSYASKIDGMDGVSSGTISTLRMISFYARANYSYKGRYSLQATIRRDGSSAFGVNNRWATFPSVSAAWNIAEEDFMKDSKFDMLKLRAGYGVSGNSLGFDAFTALATYGVSGWFDYTDPATGTTSQKRTLAATGNANPDLKWETTSMLNFGLDFSLVGGRLGGSIEVYSKDTKDLIWYYPVSTNIYPYGTMTANVGEMTNKGVEFSINAVPVQKGDWKWDTTLNLSHNTNRVKSISKGEYSVDYIDEANPNIAGFATGPGSQTQRIMEGYPLGTFYTWEWAGYNSAGRSIFYEHDAKTGERTGATTTEPQDKDRTVTGCAQPWLTLGWNNNVSWKKLSLTAFFQGNFGGKVFNAPRAQYSALANAPEKNVLKEVSTAQKWSDATYACAPSDRYIEDGSYLRLATLTLAYNFGKIQDWMQNITVYATANNVFVLTGYKGLDPEVDLGGITPGVDWREYRYPHTRTLMLGVKLGF